MPSSARRIDENGFLEVKGCPISSFGIFEYSAGQLGMAGDPNRIVKVFRPESAINNQAAIDSFKNIPLINDHEMLSGFDGDQENTAPEDYGIDGVMTGNVYYAAPWMRGDLKVFSRSMQQALKSGKRCLSLGYDCDFEERPGVWEGQPYEVVQTNMRGNHIALVEEGRVPGARVLDGRCFDSLSFNIKSTNEVNAMGVKTKKAMDKAARDSAVEELKALVPQLSAALQTFLEEEGQEEVHQEGEPDPETAGQELEQTSEPEIAGGEVEQFKDEGAEVEGSDLSALIMKAREILQALEEAAKGESEPAAEPEVESEVEEPEVAKDNVEGLQESGMKGAQIGTDGDEDDSERKDAPKKAEDAALRRFYADAAAKDSVYKRLSPVVGAFDHRAMDANQVCVYGVKKLGIKCAKGMEGHALDAYLNGVERARAEAKKLGVNRKTQDSVACDEINSYLSGEK